MLIARGDAEVGEQTKGSLSKIGDLPFTITFKGKISLARDMGHKKAGSTVATYATRPYCLRMNLRRQGSKGCSAPT